MAWTLPFTMGSRALDKLSKRTKTARDLFGRGREVGKSAGRSTSGKSGAKLDLLPAIPIVGPIIQLQTRGNRDALGRQHDSRLSALAANQAGGATVLAGGITGLTQSLFGEVKRGVGSIYDAPAKTMAEKQRERRGSWKFKPKPMQGPPAPPPTKTMAEKHLERRGRTRTTTTTTRTTTPTWTPPAPVPVPVTASAIVDTVKPPKLPAKPMALQLPKLPMPGVPTNLSQAAAAGKSFATAHGGKILAGAGMLALAGGTLAATKKKRKRSTTRRRTSQKKRSSATKRKRTSTSRRGYKPPGRKTRRNKPGGAMKARYRGKKVYVAKNGRPYILKANGQAQFVGM